MPRKIRYTAPVAGEKPAIRLEFKGPTLMTYFSLRRIARQDFDTTQTELSRRILHDWVKRYISATNGEQSAVLRQMVLALGYDGDILKAAKGQEGKGK